jgi:hypothetical protein
MKSLGFERLICLTMLLCPISEAAGTAIVNGGFETGNLTGWTKTAASFGIFPNLPNGANVYGSGVQAPGGWPFFLSQPSEGSYAFLNLFDGPGQPITLAQDILVTADAPVIAFDYRAAWAIGISVAATQDRTFDLNIISGGIDHRGLILTAQHGRFAGICCNAPPGTPGFVPDTGLLGAAVDLTPFIGQTVSLVFEWNVPERFTGPAFFQLDNVRAESGAAPEPASLALLGIGLAGLGFSRRRKQV